MNPKILSWFHSKPEQFQQDLRNRSAVQSKKTGESNTVVRNQMILEAYTEATSKQYKLKADSMSISLYEIKTPKEPTTKNPECKPYDEALKHWGNLRDAVKGLRDHLVGDELEQLDSIDTAAILAAINESDRKVAAIVKEYHKP